MKKRALSWLLAVVMVVSLAPQTIPWAKAADEDSSKSSTDAFGIQMYEWTDQEKKKAEGEAPFGSGYGTWSTILEKNELFVSMGYDRSTQRTGYYNWNGASSVSQDQILQKVKSFSQGSMTSQNPGYAAVETAPMDLNNSGKKEYVATLSFNRGSKSSGTLQLYVTDTSNNVVTNRVTVGNHGIKQLNDLDTYELKGAFSIAAGDFDGDGKDTIIVYIPKMHEGAPFIAEYAVNGGTIETTPKSTVCSNVVTLLGNSTIKENLKDQPMVSLVAEDTDKDGFDELVVTAGMNDVTTDDTHLGSRLFVYDKLTDNTWNKTYENELKVSEDNDRIVWASSTVGNMVASTSTGVDYPEILAAGFVDKDDGKHINLHGDDYIGVVGVKVTSVNTPNANNKFEVSGKSSGSKMTATNVVCNYQEMFKQRMNSNGWTKGGLYEKDDVNSLLQVQAFADRGIGEAESVFISGSVYRVTESGVTEKYKYSEFNSKDKGATSGAISQAITNTNVISVAAGNFNGNEFGQEQIIFVTALRQSGKNNTWSRVYCYYNEYDNSAKTKTDEFKGERSSYLTEHKGAFYITLNAVDPDNDSTVAYLNDVSRTYSQPDVLAILEASPYFKEIGEGEIGNSQTVYGTSTSSGSETANSFGFTVGIMVGYEHQNDLTQSGGGFETNIDNSFNWTTAKSESTEWGIEYSNDTGDNVVVVYRCPVVSYQYIDQDGKELVVSKTGEPASSMIPVEEYNEAAEQYGLDRITDENVGLADAGNPMSYRSSTTTLPNAIEADGTTAETTKNGWVQYKSSGTTTQSITKTKETAKTFDYTLDISFTAYGMIGGFKAGVNTGFSYNRSETSINGESVTKSGSVNGQNVNGYDFSWRFAAWQTKINANTIPVLGYLVQDVVAPPSPAQNLRADTITKDSITLRWDLGDRGAQQYRIYRVLDTSKNPYSLVGAVDGDQTEYTLKGLKAGESYTYVVRGVGFAEDGKAQESVDGSSTTVRTQSDDANATLELSSESLINGVLSSSGAISVIEVTLRVPDANIRGIEYEWQLYQSKNPKAGWVSIDSLKTVNATGTNPQLTMKNIDKSLDGSSLRCVVTTTNSAGDPETYYSDSVKLSLKGDQTTTSLTVNGYANGSGTQQTPYTGVADYNTTITEKKKETIQEPVKFDDYTVYKYTDPDDGSECYVGNKLNKQGEVEYVALSKDGDTYSSSGALSKKPDQYYYFKTAAKTAYSAPSGFTGEAVSKEIGGKTYSKIYKVTNAADGKLTFTEYWLYSDDSIPTGGQKKNYYYAYSNNTMSPADSQIEDTDDLRTVYYEATTTDSSNTSNTTTFILEAADPKGTVVEGEEAPADYGFEHYEVYTKTGDALPMLEKTIWVETDSNLYKGNETTPYAESEALELVTKEGTQDVDVITTTANQGTELTLKATVTGGSATTRKVNFVITNMSTGSETVLSAQSGEAVPWRAAATGLYHIVANAQSTDTTLSSSADCYYYAGAVQSGSTAETEYRLQLKSGNDSVNSIKYGGTVDLALESRTAAATKDGSAGTWQAVPSATYEVGKGNSAVKVTGTSYTPAAAENYDFRAFVGDTAVATARLEVTKIPITITPTWSSSSETMNSEPEKIDDISLTIQGADGNSVTISDIANVLKLSCDLYKADGSKKTDASSGVYVVEPVYTTVTANEKTEYTQAAKAFQSRYAVTLNTAKIYHFSEAATIKFEHGENGTVSGWYQDVSGKEFALENGNSVRTEYKVKFSATPNAGYSLTQDGWSVATNDNTVLTKGTDYTISTNNWTLTLTSEGMNKLKNKTLTVRVDFVNDKNGITFSVGSGEASGTLTAKVGENPLTSGSSVAHNATVTFTAKPADGYMVEKWVVDDAEYKWEGTKDAYRETTLELKNVSASHVVQVFFKEAATTTVHTAVDGLTAGTISVADANGTAIQPEADGTYKVLQSTALVFTANLTADGNNTVREWQTSTNDKDWTTVEGSGGKTKLTVNQHGETLYVKAVIASAQKFTLDWQIKLQGSGTVPEGATVTAKANGQEIKNGDALSAYIPVDFALTLDQNYYLVKWEGAEGTGNTAKLSSLDKNTTVIVTIAKKPVVTVFNPDATTSGNVTVTGTVNGSSATPNNYVDYKTALTILLQPKVGYVVEGIHLNDSNTAIGTNQMQAGKGDDYTYVIDSLEQDVKIVPVWTKLTEYAINFSVVNPGDGKHGTLAATAERKGMENYKTAYENFQSGGIVYAGSTVTFTAAPNEGYRVKEWRVGTEVYRLDGSTTDFIEERLTLDAVEAAKGVTVQFTPIGNKVIIQAEGQGTITSARVGLTEQLGNISEGFVLQGGSAVTITAAPSQGYEVMHWIVNGKIVPGTENQNRYTYSAETNSSGALIKAVFQPVNYTVRWSGENGTVTKTDGETTKEAQVRGGTSIIFHAAPDNGYVLSGWTVNGETVENATNPDFTWSVPLGVPAEQEYTVKAIFQRNATPLTVTYQVEGNVGGTIATANGQDGSVSVVYGGDVTFTAEPDEYYSVKEWKVGSNTVPNSDNKSEYTLQNVTEDTMVTVVFQKALSFTVRYEAGQNGTIQAKENGQSLQLETEHTKDIPGGSTLEFKAVPATGSPNYMVAKWTVNNVEVTKDNMSKLGVTMEQGHPLSNTLTIENLSRNVVVKAEFVEYTKVAVPSAGTGYVIQDVQRVPAETYANAPTNEIRKNGDLTFTVKPNGEDHYMTIGTLIVNGYDCIANKATTAGLDTQKCDSVSATKNENGSYTVTIINVQADIETKIVAHKVIVGSLTVPLSLANKEGFKTPQEIQTKLEAKLTGRKDGMDFYDIALKTYDSAMGKWIEVTDDNFPPNGVDVKLGYPQNTDSKDTFQIVHMLTKSGREGEIEKITPENKSDGLHFHVDSLSPFGVSWVKYVAPTPGGGGGGGGAVSTCTLTFDTNGGSAIDKITKDSGTTIDLATYKPTRAGYTFAGWFSDKALTKAVTSVKLTANTTVYAKWTESGGTAENPFVDVKEGAYYYDAVLWAVEQKITSGTSATTFSPDASCTRAQMVTFLWRAAGSPKVENGKNPFTDVKADAYYYDAVLWAVEKGVTSGTSATTFSPDATVTRGQTVTFLYRNAGSPEVSGTMPFTDVEADAYYAKAVQWAVQQKITTGTSETTFSPMSDCTRGQIVTFLYRAK